MLIISLFSQLISNAVTLRRDKSILYSRTGISIMIYCIFNILYTKSTINAINLYGGLFHVTEITHVFHIFFFIICGIILQITAYYPRKFIQNRLDFNRNTKSNQMKQNNIKIIKSIISVIINKTTEQFKILEYPLIILFIINGAILLMSTGDLISMFLSIELQSYGLYILSTIYKNSELATKGGLTYFLLGGLSSCFILLGSALLYANTATTNLYFIYVITSLSDSSEEALYNIYSSYYINISLIIMSVGFLFKVSAAPFHFWSPEVYDSIPTTVTIFVAIVAKISIFIFFLDILQNTGSRIFNLEFSWVNTLLFSSLLSLIIGAVVGLTQNRIKRLFAYSTISHIGFIILALSIDTVESIQAFIFYLMQYSISNLNVFIILISIGYSFYLKTNENNKYELLQDQNNSPIQFIKQLKGLSYINPMLALSLAITILSFIGVPPLIGFFGKQMVLSAALDSGYVFITIIAILTSVISAVYYLNIIKEIYFYSPDKNLSININSNLEFNKEYQNNIKLNKNIVLSSYLTISISILTIGTLIFMFVSKEWLNMANILALNLNNR